MAPKRLRPRTRPSRLTVTPTDKTQVGATLAQSGTGTSGMTQTVGLSVDAHPTTKLEVSASYGGKNAPGTDGDSQTINLKTVLTPDEDRLAGDLGGAVPAWHGDHRPAGRPAFAEPAPDRAARRGPGPAPEGDRRLTRTRSIPPSPRSTAPCARCLSWSFPAATRAAWHPPRDTDTGDLFDTSAARVSVSPFKSVHLVGTYAQNPDDDDTLQRLARKGVGLETTFGALGLSGGYDWSRRYDAPDTEETIHADLGLRFSPATQLTVGFQTRQNALDPSTSQSVAYTVGFTHNLGDRFSLSLNGKRQQTSATASDYNASANLGMKF